MFVMRVCLNIERNKITIAKINTLILVSEYGFKLLNYHKNKNFRNFMNTFVNIQYRKLDN